MLAGRGLAHTGGTIDKLESIPGFNTGLSMIEMQENPCFISRQTDQIAPTDKIMYATRDVTSNRSMHRINHCVDHLQKGSRRIE